MTPMTAMTAMKNDDARTYATALAGGRAALGVVALLAPALAARPWVGAVASLPQARMLARALGARDLALGVGALLAVRHETPVRGWIEAGGLADAGDVVATVIAFRWLPPRGRWAVLAAAAGGAVTSRLLAPALR